MNWSRLICGGGGWTLNAKRRSVIDRVKINLEMWRDFDNPEYLNEARRLLAEEAQ